MHFIVLSLLVGISTGALSSLLLYLIYYGTELRFSYSWLYYLLPLGGLGIGLMYHKSGRNLENANALIIDEIKDEKKDIPFVLIPLILVSSFLSHLLGASSGREGGCVQLGGSIADRIRFLYKEKKSFRQKLILCGVGSGVSAALGSPLGGALFGIEVGGKKHFSFWLIVGALLSSFASFYVSNFLNIPRGDYPLGQIFLGSFENYLYLIVVSFFFSILALFYEKAITNVRKFKPVKKPYLYPFLMGIIVVVLLQFFENKEAYMGLGMGDIITSFGEESDLFKPFFKALFTSLSLGGGFQGGEFVPMIYMGTTFGSALSTYIPLGVSFLAAMGFSSILASVTKSPLACAVIGCEIFGFHLIIPFFVCCTTSFLFYMGFRKIFDRLF